MNSKPTNQPPEGRGATIKTKEEILDSFRPSGTHIDYTQIYKAMEEYAQQFAAPPATVIQPLGFQDEVEDELRMIISHAFLGEEHNISRESFDLAIKESAKYFIKLLHMDKIICRLDQQQCQQECEHKDNRKDCPFTTPPPQPEDALAGKYADKMIDLGWRDNTDKDVIISDFKSGYSAKPDLINLKKIVENAHMAGQRNAGIDPSYHAALHYYNSEIKDVAPQSSTSEEERDNFSISFAIWALHDPQAKSYQEAGITAYGLLEKYKDRPYINTDTSKQ